PRRHRLRFRHRAPPRHRRPGRRAGHRVRRCRRSGRLRRGHRRRACRRGPRRLDLPPPGPRHLGGQGRDSRRRAAGAAGAAGRGMSVPNARGAAAGPSAPVVAYGPDGLVPAVVQDRADGRVLMLAWMDAEALAATLETGEVHFHSRSRDRLWRKGETSGNVLRLVDWTVDCDGDALLVTVDPVGPTCHRGTRSCFDADGAPAERDTQGFAWLETLWATI